MLLKSSWKSKKMKYLFFILAALLLSGCGAKVIASTHKQVLVENVSASNMDEALEVAEKECQKHQKHAVYVPADVGYRLAGYSCVEE
jgi:uncharacterized lipoprotein YajG